MEINEINLNWTSKASFSSTQSELRLLDSVTRIEYLNGNVMLFLTTGFDFFVLIAVSSPQILKNCMV